MKSKTTQARVSSTPDPFVRLGRTRNPLRKETLMHTRDPYRDWSLADRQDAWRDGDWAGCRRYDDDRDSSDRAYDEWFKGGDFRDPEDGHRFS